MNLPNKLTIFRTLLVPVFIACFFLEPYLNWWNWLAAALFFIADMTDIVDGAIARKYNLVTDFGRLMDPMADKLLFCSAFIMLTGRGMLPPLFTVLFIGRELVISAFRLVAVQNGTVIAANWLGKTKATLQVIAILFILLDNFGFRWLPFSFAGVVTHLAAVFTVWSAVDYIVKNRKAVHWA